jgi:beta-lactamase regulating signal transducer with metallopeptidase domain/peptidoglycan/xylan/chitin deacetylase (PgdA/CDA1 family)
MNWEIIADSKLVKDLGWTLVHSIWQVALVATILFSLLKALGGLSANARYILTVSAFVLSIAIPVVTFIQLSSNSAPARPENIGPERSDFNGVARARGNSEQIPISTDNRTAINIVPEDTSFSLAAIRDFFDKNLTRRMPLAVGLWLLGIAFFALRLTGGVWQLHKYRTREVSAPERDWREKFDALKDKLGISAAIGFLRSNLVETPVVVGWLKPIVLVPTGLFLQIDPRELEIILAHELIHIRRYDPLVNLLQSGAEVLFFYHPLVWWMSAQIRKEREFAADARVLEVFSNSRVSYANALANLEEIRLLTNQQMPSLVTASNGGNLMQRIQKILQKNTGRQNSNSAWSAALAVLLIPAVLIGIFSVNSSVFVNAQNKTKSRKIAVGFVGLPPVDRSDNAPKDSDATARLMIAKLTQHKIPAIGFLNGSMVSDGEKLFPVRANIVKIWNDAGFEVGIGNFKHVWFYDTPYDEYVAGVEKNEATVKKVLGEKAAVRFFSYPYLNTGKSVEERDRFETWLKSRGITPVKYTIDNQEWMYSYAYDMARNDNDISTMTEIRVAFVNYMSKMFDHFEAYSQEMFGRDVNQTMVLTPSRLVTDSFDDLFGMIKKRGYEFVSMEEALSDEAYKTPENFIGKAGISWFERWRMASGKRLRDEPGADSLVQKIWDEKKPK